MKTPLALNSLIDTRYKVLKVLGEGGFGIAYLCQDLSLNTQVVLKECFPEPTAVKLKRQGTEIFALSQGDLDKFGDYKESAIKEAKRMSALKHPNIVHVKNYITSNGTVYLIMEFIEGKSLDKVIKERQFDATYVFNILISLLGALDVLHSKNIFHKDLKPENIMIRKDGSPVIIDFGAARSATELKQKKTMIYSGSYSAPELTAETLSVDGRCDIFSLGVIMHEVITGKIPSLNVRNNGVLKGTAYEGIYNKNFLASIDKARACVDTDRFSSARAWLRYLKRVQKAGALSDSGYKASPKTKDKVDFKERRYENESQDEAELDTEFTLSEDNSGKLFIYTVLLVIAGIFVFMLDWEMSTKLKVVFFIIAAGVVPLWRTASSKAKEELSLYFAEAGNEFDFDLHLNADPILFGRGESADIKLPSVDKYMCVSREHFTIFYREGEIIINNLKGEENPILVNGHRLVGEASISTGVGSIFKIGNLTFRLKERE